jgi:hypothetical protein
MLKALDNDALELSERARVADTPFEPVVVDKTDGYNPYDTSSRTERQRGLLPRSGT